MSPTCAWTSAKPLLARSLFSLAAERIIADSLEKSGILKRILYDTPYISFEIANSSKVALQIVLSRVPFVAGARDYAAEWIFPGGSFDNRHYFESQVRFSPEIEEIDRMLLFDAQTSGGLLLCVPPDRLEELLESARRLGQPLWQIGEVVVGEGIDVVD